MNQAAAYIVLAITVVSLWMLFQKAGDKGWKAIIPFYNSYTAYKLFWKKAMFWVTLVIALAASVINVGVMVRHSADMNGFVSAVADDVGMSEEDLINGNFNMTEEELNQAAENYTQRLGADLESGADTRAANALKALIANFSALDGVLLILAGILMLIAVIISIVYYSKLSKSFGHGVGFTLGLIFLNPIFMLILAFGKSEYVGNNA